MLINELLNRLNLTELRMNPSALAAQVANIDARVGVEFELYVPGAAKSDEPEIIDDYSKNPKPESKDDIYDFFTATTDNKRLTRIQEFNIQTRLDNSFDEFENTFHADELDYATEAAWIKEHDWDTMQSVGEELNLPWPKKRERFLVPTWTREDVIDSFSTTIGRQVIDDKYGNISGSARHTTGNYILSDDTSLTSPADEKDVGMEFISPPLGVEDMLHDLTKVQEWARKHGCYTNESTGLHVNVSIAGANWAKLDYVKLAILLGDEYVLEKFGREANRYAEAAISKVREKAADPNIAGRMLNAMKSVLDDRASRIVHDIVSAKYTSINVKTHLSPGQRRVEFRSPGGDWLGSNYPLIRDTMLRFVVALDAALDPNKARKEYQTKLYKLLTRTPTDIDAMKLFSAYVAGDIDTRVLRSLLTDPIRREIKPAPLPGAKNARP